uniref:Uncharacterized protein n=1 Tax=Hanusia phi TaxID=3032 RepID=A0A6T7T1W9_9CRYP|mmetsp:Transcript_5653/g.13124  ORF Transcript_5653/g.13124 Transcript_5653/m.13124 type:complete len:516 (+) Transcript_5653:124-1671(+)
MPKVCLSFLFVLLLCAWMPCNSEFPVDHALGSLLHGRKLLQYLGISSFDMRESRLVVSGGCLLDLATSMSRACALITETVPFYYIDPATRTIKVNQTLTTSDVRWICWGSTYTNPFPNVDVSLYSDFSIGYGFKTLITACGVEIGTNFLACFGANDPSVSSTGAKIAGQADPPAGKFSQVSVGGLHACAITNFADTAVSFSSNLVCWGNNRMGQTTVPPITQVSILTTINYTFVNLGYEYSCALRSDNRLTCFGSDLDQSLDMPDRVLATNTKNGGYMSSTSSYGCCHDCSQCDCSTLLYAGVGARCSEQQRLAVSWYHTCAIRAGCDVQCQGKNPKCSSGSLSTWYAKDTNCFCNSCVRPHELECWGYNAWGNANAPPGKFKVVRADVDFTCAIYAECNNKDVLDVTVAGTGKSQCQLANNIVCFGRNNQGQVSPPADMCNGAAQARLAAEARLNNTIFATPAPPTPRPACICTPQGCDCLGEYPRLQFESACRPCCHLYLLLLLCGLLLLVQA